jgi:hypothetical protein
VTCWLCPDRANSQVFVLHGTDEDGLFLVALARCLAFADNIVARGCQCMCCNVRCRREDCFCGCRWWCVDAVGTDMCLSRSSMCCLCCFSLSLIAMSLSPLSAQSCVYPMPISSLIDSCPRHYWRVWCAANVLGLLFAADVHLLLGGLALGESITVVD